MPGDPRSRRPEKHPSVNGSENSQSAVFVLEDPFRGEIGKRADTVQFQEENGIVIAEIERDRVRIKIACGAVFFKSESRNHPIFRYIRQSVSDPGKAREFRELVRIGTDGYGEYGQARTTSPGTRSLENDAPVAAIADSISVMHGHKDGSLFQIVHATRLAQ